MSAVPNRDRRAERREGIRREILDAAWEIARRDGIAAITLRGIGLRIGMRAPSLYSHFESKNAIYDAMFEQAWDELGAMFDAKWRLPTAAPRRSLLSGAQVYFDFAAADLARYQLMNQRTIPEFDPSASAYRSAVAVYDWMRAVLRVRGVRSQADLDLWTALLSGFADQQLANDPGGTRWRRQLPRLVDMFCDEVGIPGPPLRRKK